MAVIYLKHKTHGAKVAVSREEADADVNNGWVEFDPTTPEITLAASQNTPETPILNALQPRRERARK